MRGTAWGVGSSSYCHSAELEWTHARPKDDTDDAEYSIDSRRWSVRIDHNTFRQVGTLGASVVLEQSCSGPSTCRRGAVLIKQPQLPSLRAALSRALPEALRALYQLFSRPVQRVIVEHRPDRPPTAGTEIYA